MDGTVIAAGNNEFGQCEVQDWHDIVAIAQDVYCSFGIKKDGSVVATGQNECGQEEIRTWQDIQAIYTCADHPIGLKRNGTLVTVDGERDFGQQAMKEWNDIVDLCMDESGYVIGLRRDGTVAVSNPERRTPSGWQEIVAITSDAHRTYGIKRDGTVLTNESAYSEERIISQWDNIIALSTNASIVGLTADGRVVTAGEEPKSVKQALEQWKLFGGIDTLEQERKEASENSIQAVRTVSPELEDHIAALREEHRNLHGLFANRRRKEIEQEIKALESQMD
jgi:alpha-tubulin suppressor-like RCC1 family protein/gas vesicle protein